jgi:hypothetical protein
VAQAEAEMNAAEAAQACGRSFAEICALEEA